MVLLPTIELLNFPWYLNADLNIFWRNPPKIIIYTSKVGRFYRNFWTKNKLTKFFCCSHTGYIFCTCAMLSIIHCWTHFQRTALSMIACIHWHERETFACEFSFNFKFIWGNVSFTNLQNNRHIDSVQYQWKFCGQFYVEISKNSFKKMYYFGRSYGWFEVFRLLEIIAKISEQCEKRKLPLEHEQHSILSIH